MADKQLSEEVKKLASAHVPMMPGDNTGSWLQRRDFLIREIEALITKRVNEKLDEAIKRWIDYTPSVSRQINPDRAVPVEELKSLKIKETP